MAACVGLKVHVQDLLLELIPQANDSQHTLTDSRPLFQNYSSLIARENTNRKSSVELIEPQRADK